ncbi:hypothetical protein CR513_32012, partial [Mucuna pruriens]
MGRPTLNKFKAVVSTYHQCMKYPIGLRVGSRIPVINVLDLDLNPRCQFEHERPHLVEEVKEVQIGTALGPEDEASLVNFLRKNCDVFA